MSKEITINLKYKINQRDLINMINDANKRIETLRAFAEFENIFNVNKGSRDRHQVYVGGLKDHNILVTLVAILSVKNMITPIRFLFDLDDIIISSTFHDFDKLGKYENDPLFQTHMDVIEYLDQYGLNNKNVRDGILHSHGGWSYDEKIRWDCSEVHGPTGIILHMADMVASDIMTSEEETKRMIVELERFVDLGIS